jgi:flagellar basal-body rod protein FlgF
MDRLIYTSLSGQAAIDQRLRQVTNEVSNVNTTGFKSSYAAALQTFTYDGSGFPTRYSPSLTPPLTVNMAPGAVQTTGQPLDISLGGTQLLTVRAKDGSNAYTRRGDLHVAADNTLTTATGLQVLSDTGGPITIPALSTVKIGTDGTVFVQAQGQQPARFTPLARLGIVDSPANSVAMREDALFQPSPGTTFTPAVNPMVAPETLESSNSNLFKNMVDMISLSRQYELEVKTLKNADDLADRSSTLAKVSP